jgi:hypothetical protein
VVAAVLGAEDCAVGSAGPGYSVAEVVDAAKTGGGVGVLDVPLGAGLNGQGEHENNYGEAHGSMVTDGSAVALAASDWVLHRYPLPPYLSPKVFERKDLSPDFGMDLIWIVAKKKPGFCRALCSFF